MNQHQLLFDSVTQPVDSLTEQQGAQQQQLSSIAQILKQINDPLQHTNVCGASQNSYPPLSVFHVSKPDKFDALADLCPGFLLQCAIFIQLCPQL